MGYIIVKSQNEYILMTAVSQLKNMLKSHWTLADENYIKELYQILLEKTLNSTTFTI